MVRKYVKKKEKSYDDETLKRALTDVEHGGKSVLEAAKSHNIPYTTLLRLSKKETLPFSGGRFKPVFNFELERLLMDYIVTMSKRFLGMTTLEIRRFAYELADANQCPIPNSWKTNRTAGKDWLNGYIKRHGNTLSLRKPEATSLARASGFNKPVVMRFYNLLRDVLLQLNVDASRIYNVDETGLSTTQVPTKVYSAKGQKQVGKIVSQERGLNVTAVCCVNAVGQYVPPMLIFPRVRANPALLHDAPPQTVAQYNPSGWMTEEIFLSWMQHFQRFSHCTKENKVLLLLDNHASHISLNVVQYALEHGIEMVSFPPHCSHKLQPLDRTFYGPLKIAYRRACDDWMAANPGQPITIYQVAGRFCTAYMNAATIRNGVKGFQCTGIVPLDSQIFADDEFAPSLTTDREIIEIIDLNIEKQVVPLIQEIQQENAEQVTPLLQEVQQENGEQVAPLVQEVQEENGEQVTPLVQKVQQPCCSSKINGDQPLKLTTPEVLRPFPKGDGSRQHTSKRRVVSTWLTESKQKSIIKMKATENGVKRRSTSRIQKTDNRAKRSKTEDRKEGNTKCVVCLQVYNESIEEWLRCVACMKWACETCFGSNHCANCEK